MDLEVVFNDYMVRKQALLDYKLCISHSCHIGIFKRGQPMILVKKLIANFLFVGFRKKWALK